MKLSEGSLLQVYQTTLTSSICYWHLIILQHKQPAAVAAAAFSTTGISTWVPRVMMISSAMLLAGKYKDQLDPFRQGIQD